MNYGQHRDCGRRAIRRIRAAERGRVPMLTDLLERNLQWSQTRNAEDPGFFARLAAQQAPEFFWIGCSDSRVPANVVAGLDPGEVFVHRNIANVVHSSDMNLLSALEFAVETLKVREIIVCGHYGCGGVKAATEELPHGLADHWLEPIRRLARSHARELDRAPDLETLRDRLAELNVIDGVRRVCETPIMRKAWSHRTNLRVHGLIYGLKDGRLRNLGCTVGAEDVAAAGTGGGGAP
jgi:carbonic anhydrase